MGEKNLAPLYATWGCNVSISTSASHTLVLPFSMPGKAAVSALLNSPLGLWVSLKIKDFKYILHDLVSKINIKFLKKYIYRKERKIFVHFIVSKTYSKLLRLHMPRFLLKKAKPGYAYAWYFRKLMAIKPKIWFPRFCDGSVGTYGSKVRVSKKGKFRVIGAIYELTANLKVFNGIWTRISMLK